MHIISLKFVYVLLSSFICLKKKDQAQLVLHSENDRFEIDDWGKKNTRIEFALCLSQCFGSRCRNLNE